MDVGGSSKHAGINMADTGDFHLKHSEAPQDPGKDFRGLVEGQAKRHAVAAVDRRPEAAITAAAASRGDWMSGEMDDVLEGVPAYPAAEEDEDEDEDEEDEDEEDEDWQFTLPKGTLEDDDMNSPLSAEEGQRTRNNQQCGDGPQVEKAGGPAYNSSSASAAGAAVEQSKGPDDNQVPKGPSEAAPQAPEPPPQAPEPPRQAPEPPRQAPEPPPQAPEPPPQAPEPPPQAPEPPLLTIKDEPEDEGYDGALLPQTSISKIKEEHKDEELKISSVFSFRGGNAFAQQGGPAPFSQPTTTIFIPGRGALLQASTLASLGIKPRLPAPAPAPAPTMLALPQALSQPQPLAPPAVISTIRCSGCSKVLVKGQTAFQRKGATQLFCSTVCLSSHLPPTSKARSCYQCNKEIDDPKSMVMVPLDSNTFMHFCSHNCLAASSMAKKNVAQVLYKPRLLPQVAKELDKPHCIVCKSTSKIEHEVTHQAQIHSLCSDACFLEWRKSRQLAMNCCEGCGLYCKSDSDSCQTLTVEKAQLNFCSPTCVSTYKQSCVKNTECSICHDSVRVSNTIMERDQMGKVQLYCSITCVGQSRSSTHMLTGTAFPCSQCSLNRVPQYHLAMSDGHIRNFCSHDCVSVFRLKKDENSSEPNPVNGAASGPSYSSAPPALTDGPLPGPLSRPESPVPPRFDRSLPHVTYPGGHSRVTSVPPLEPAYSDLASQAHPAPPSSPGHALTQAPPTHSQLTCHQCSQRFDTKPLLFSYQGRISMFCDAACCEQYKTQRNIMAPCESCRLDNVVFEVLTFNQRDRVFCSQACKQQFREEALAGGKGPWRPCSYCGSVSQKMVHSHYSGRVEEFCRPHCMSQYTVLFYGMARCDGCRQPGYLEEKLQCTSSVRNFCSRACLMQYCYLHFEAGGQRAAADPAGAGRALPPPHAPSQAHHPSKMNPVGGDVVCLASDSAARPHATGALPTPYTHDKTIYHASTQTDAMRPSGPRRCQVKNKSVLCRPFTLNQETMCQLPEPPAETSDASTAAPAPSPVDPLPERLTGRHFLAKRLWGSVDCVVCGHRTRKRAKEESEREEEEAHTTRKRGRTEELEGESGKVRVGETEEGDKKEAEALEQKRHLEEVVEVPAETEDQEERGETGRPAKETRERREPHKEGAVETGVEGVVGRGAAAATDFYCQMCPGQPGLCAAPCFELYHTRLLYWLRPEQHAQGDGPNTPHASGPLPSSAATQTHAIKADPGQQ